MAVVMGLKARDRALANPAQYRDSLGKVGRILGWVGIAVYDAWTVVILIGLCWRPAFARHLPSLHRARHDLQRYLHYYNTDRAHTGRNNKGRVPIEILGKAKMWSR